MLNVKNRQARLQIIVEVAIKNNITPNNNTFAGLVKKICCSKFAMTPKQAQEYTEILCIAWRADQWQGYTEEPYTPTYTQNYIPQEDNTEAKAQEMKETLRRITESDHEEIKRIEKIATTQTDNITDEALIQILYNMAKKDAGKTGVGRILLLDAADRKTLTSQEIIQLWQKAYPTIEIEQATGNVLKIYFNEKTQIRQQRDQRKPIIPEKFP